MKVLHLLAPNPSVMTGPGTNTWLVVDEREALIIDPGPMIDDHLEAIRTAVDGTRVVGVAVTHTHPDHAPAANPLAEGLGVPAIGPGPGPGFAPDRVVSDGDPIPVGGVTVAVIATPGHTADSICYRVGDVLFTGDHVMGGSTVMVEDMAAYLASLERVLAIGIEAIHPGHGPIVDEPDAVVRRYLAHRREREAQIAGALADGAGTVGEIVQRIYTDVDPSLHPAAAVSVGAHLRKLADEGAVDLPAGTDWGSPVRGVGR